MSVQYGYESWPQIGRDFLGLGKIHFEEVDAGVEVARPYRPDTVLFLALDKSGALKIWTARDGGKLVGYIFWIVQPDMESRGMMIAEMGPWFVLPGYFGVADELFTWSLAGLKGLGVKYAYPHHRMNGRGKNLGKYFRRMGAVEIQHTYSLRLGG